MPTINDRGIINDIIARVYDDDGDYNPAMKIVEYTNNWGGVTWGVVHQRDIDRGAGDRYESSPAVHNPKVIWERKG